LDRIQLAETEPKTVEVKEWDGEVVIGLPTMDREFPTTIKICSAMG
jgi:hypothetical protein